MEMVWSGSPEVNGLVSDPQRALDTHKYASGILRWLNGTAFRG